MIEIMIDGIGKSMMIIEMYGTISEIETGTMITRTLKDNKGKTTYGVAGEEVTTIEEETMIE
jgi:hypothetical protein